MIAIKQTAEFAEWLDALQDRMAQARIAARIKRLSGGNFGDLKYLREGVSELRVDHGPGYRVYVARRGDEYVVLLAGGDKRTQDRDIERAVALARSIEER